MIQQPEAQPPAGAPKRRRARLVFRLMLWSGAGALVLAATACLAGYLLYDHVTRPGSPGELVRMTIPEGLSGRQTGELLVEHGLLEHELFFRLATRLDGSGRPIKHGFYELPKGLSASELLRMLQDGTSWMYDPEAVPEGLRITVPEGLTLKQMAQRFDDPEAFLEAASDPELIRRLGIGAETLEGFLMPNTYFFAKPPTERQVVVRMLDQFKREYEGLVREFPHAAARDILEVVTIASLIERESRVEHERPLVAAVIYNRLRKNMTLDLDSTLQYALDKHGERVLYADKEVDSPYNTYRRSGLPPGPIANPGVACLRAAINPADADYLFFVSNADGSTHTFSRTMAEHLRAVERFRRDIAVQRRRQRAQQEADADDEG